MTYERDTLKAYFRMIAVHDPMRGNELVDALDAYLDVKFRREWHGLTDEDREDIDKWIEFKEANGNEPVPAQKLITYVEAKLREKNSK